MTSASGGDSFTFNNVTTNGPAAFGTGATAISGAPSAEWIAQLHRILADFNRQWPQSPAAAEPVQAARVQEALTGVNQELQRSPVDKEALRDRLGRFSAVVATLAGLAGIADRIREWMS
ncbi:hypothetical protein [Dactylosporangium sp. CA-092794]|uniref:hypothetical protein n=1 Tax=Dactylosporangium sp. CA-092794 TaxID=3239929 RepID=UPI003D8F481E